MSPKLVLRSVLSWFSLDSQRIFTIACFSRENTSLAELCEVELFLLYKAALLCLLKRHHFRLKDTMLLK